MKYLHNSGSKHAKGGEDDVELLTSTEAALLEGTSLGRADLIAYHTRAARSPWMLAGVQEPRGT